MDPNARQQLVTNIQKELLKLNTSQLQDIIRSIDDPNLANGIEKLSDTDLRKLVDDYMSSAQLISLKDEGLSQLRLLDERIKDLLESTGSDTSKQSSVGVGKIVAISAGAVGAVGAVALAPVVLGAVGFTSAGIAAGSYAASMMSAAAVANGGGVAAGSLVALLQSAGAAGLSGAATAAVAGTGTGVGAALGAGLYKLTHLFDRKKQ